VIGNIVIMIVAVVFCIATKDVGNEIIEKDLLCDDWMS